MKYLYRIGRKKMSKKDELQILRRQRSVDAPVNVHQRTGGSEAIGSMLDLYVQVSSAEDTYLGNLDEYAREKFQKGFDFYLKKVFTDQEREFLSHVLAGGENVYTVAGLLRVKYIALLQEIQRKAYKNIKPLLKLARVTGWSGAKDFIATILERLKKLSEGSSIDHIIPQYKCEKEIREKRYGWFLQWVKTHLERRREIARLSSRRCFLRAKEEKEAESRLEMNASFEELSEKLATWIAAKEAGKDKSDPSYVALDAVNNKVVITVKKWLENKDNLQWYKRKRGITQ